jgi:hypothetical protein
MLNVANNPFMLSAAMLSVIMLNDVMPSVVAPLKQQKQMRINCLGDIAKNGRTHDKKNFRHLMFNIVAFEVGNCDNHFLCRFSLDV